MNGAGGRQVAEIGDPHLLAADDPAELRAPRRAAARAIRRACRARGRSRSVEGWTVSPRKSRRKSADPPAVRLRDREPLLGIAVRVDHRRGQARLAGAVERRHPDLAVLDVRHRGGVCDRRRGKHQRRAGRERSASSGIEPLKRAGALSIGPGSRLSPVPPSSEQAARRVLDRADELATYTEEPGRITRPLLTPAMAGARARVRDVDAGGGPRDARGRARQPRRPPRRGAADDRLAPGLGGRRGPLRRHPRHPGRAGARRRADRRAARGRGLRRRGRAALQSLYLGSRAFVGELDSTSAFATRRASRCGEALEGDLGRAALRPRARAPTSRSTSSRARCSKPKVCRSAS